jgi:hypothetical protein
MSTRRFLLCGGLATLATLSLWPSRALAAGAKVLIVGDSMIAGAFGLYLEQRLRKRAGHEVLRRGKSSSGLSRPDFFDWMEEGERLCSEFSPDAVVVMFGGNDGQGLYMGRGAEPKWIRWHEPGWTEEYARRVAAFADLVASPPRQLFWVGMPVMRPEKLDARISHLNTIYRGAMEGRPGATFLDVYGVLAASEGGYADYVEVDGKRVRVRASDGVHLSGPGATVLVGHVAPAIEASLGRGA